uniref:Uncharacterized protein n=1 Tax=Tanacetum cinerariifolium TaxID=118510 RepID=A0A6L2N600_TANCI|nr:hypothetical protein [Tanacetum cinerariifolium]
MVLLSVQLLIALKNGSDFLASFERNRLSAANFPLRLCTSLSVLGGSRSVTTLTFKGLALIPYLYTLLESTIGYHVIDVRFEVSPDLIIEHLIGQSLVSFFCILQTERHLLVVKYSLPIEEICFFLVPFDHLYLMVALSVDLCSFEEQIMRRIRPYKDEIQGFCLCVWTFSYRNFRGTSLRGQECSPEKPTSGILESTLSALMDGFNDQLMLRVFPITLSGATSRWLRNEPAGLDVPTRQILDSKGGAPKMNATDGKKAIQEMVDYSQKWHDETSTRSKSSNTSDGLAAIQAL